jgi:hypothetical protein
MIEFSTPPGAEPPMSWQNHIHATVYLYPTQDGGRSGPTPSDKFGCPLKFEPNAVESWDFKIDLSTIGSLCPGHTYFDVPAEFLSPELVLPKLMIGTRLYMWERNIIGTLDVTRIAE